MLPLIVTFACAQPLPVHEGRPIAPVMSWQGASWLEREGRAREEATDRMLKQLDLEPGDRVADLGCGTGFHARRMKREVGEKGTVYCVDLQPEMLERARQLAASEGVDLALVQGATERIPLPDDSLDHLLLVDVFHELQEPSGMLAEMRRVLSTTGQVHLVEFRLEGQTATHIKREHRMALPQIRRELEQAGFEAIRIYEKLPSQHLVSARPTPR